MSVSEAGTINNSSENKNTSENGNTSENKDSEKEFQRRNQWNTILKMTFPEVRKLAYKNDAIIQVYKNFFTKAQEVAKSSMTVIDRRQTIQVQEEELKKIIALIAETTPEEELSEKDELMFLRAEQAQMKFKLSQNEELEKDEDDEDKDEDDDEDENKTRNKFNLNKDYYKISIITVQSFNLDTVSHSNSKRSPYRYGLKDFNSESTFIMNDNNEPKLSVVPSAPPLINNLNESIPFFKTPNRSFKILNEYLNEKNESTVKVDTIPQLTDFLVPKNEPNIELVKLVAELTSNNKYRRLYPNTKKFSGSVSEDIDYYRPGKNHLNADALSRPVINYIINNESNDNECVSRDPYENKILYELITTGKERCDVFKSVVIKLKIMAKIKDEYYWHGMVNDIYQWVKQCTVFQRNNKCITKYHPAQSTNLSKIFTRVAIDLIFGLDETEDGYNGILVIIEFLTNFPYAKPIKSKSAKEKAEILIEYITLFGPFSELLSDQGREFLKPNYVRTKKMFWILTYSYIGLQSKDKRKNRDSIIVWDATIYHVCPLYKIAQETFNIEQNSDILISNSRIAIQATGTTELCGLKVLTTLEGMYVSIKVNNLVPNHTIGGTNIDKVKELLLEESDFKFEDKYLTHFLSDGSKITLYSTMGTIYKEQPIKFSEDNNSRTGFLTQDGIIKVVSDIVPYNKIIQYLQLPTIDKTIIRQRHGSYIANVYQN
ncbi:unnamed protein product [Brachionus calyciflorus]|uniref:Integrase catalytic domain-containing protein n=1 Tax=Brachionus calyciflorus TaxID=104777 RepID=A0A814BE73_9BILA|nr:unnamed protein product [Brachionus calyciflorus]